MTTRVTAKAIIAPTRPAGDQAIQVNQPTSWPAKLRELVDGLSYAAPPTKYTSDLELPDDADDHVRALLTGRGLRAYHATRLLDHERALILKQGLRVFSRDLFEERIRAAYAHAEISEAEHEQLLGAHMYATSEQYTRGDREGKVCLILSEHAFDDEVSGLWPLLSTWGGEGIYFSSRGVEMAQLLRRLGRPTVVAVSVPVMPSEARQPSFPDLARVLVGAARGLRVGADVHHPEPIPPTAVSALWQPGDPRYERHAHLPRDPTTTPAAARAAAVCKTVAKATLVRIQYPPPPAQTASDQHERQWGPQPVQVGRQSG